MTQSSEALSPASKLKILIVEPDRTIISSDFHDNVSGAQCPLCKVFVAQVAENTALKGESAPLSCRTASRGRKIVPPRRRVAYIPSMIRRAQL